MPPFVNEYWTKLQGLWTDRTVSQRILIGGLAAAVVISFALMIY